MKSLLAIAAGYLSMIVLEGFARLVIAFYHRLPLSFTGVESMPSTIWIIFFLALILFLGFFGALLTTSIANFDHLKHSATLALLILITRFIPALFNQQVVEYAYALAVPLISIIGVFLGLLLKLQMEKNQQEQVEAS